MVNRYLLGTSLGTFQQRGPKATRASPEKSSPHGDEPTPSALGRQVEGSAIAVTPLQAQTWDMIFVYQLFHSGVDADLRELFDLVTVSSTRGHPFKVCKPRATCRVGR